MIKHLKSAIAYLLNAPFILPGTEPSHIAEAIGLDSFEYQIPEIVPFLTHYFASDDDKGIHCYSSVEDHKIIIAETRSFFDQQTGVIDDDIYETVDSLFKQEFDSIRSLIRNILGSPTYSNDQFSEYSWAHRHDDSENRARRDIALEKQMVHHLGEIRLTYWAHGDRVLYLILGQVDNEEPVTIILGCRPQK